MANEDGKSSGARPAEDRREVIAALLGGLGVTALAGCVGRQDGDAEDAEDERVGQAKGAVGGSAMVQYADVVSDLRPRTGGASSLAVLKGYSSIGDGGGGVFYWSSVAALDDGGTILNQNAGAGGVAQAGWRRVYTGALNVRWFGAAGDGVQVDTARIQAAIAAVGPSGGAVYFPPGIYIVTRTVGGPPTIFLLPDDITLYGDGPVSVIKVQDLTGEYYAMFGPLAPTPPPSGIVFRDLSFDQNPAGTCAGFDGHKYIIALVDCVNFTLARCELLYCGSNAVNISGAASQDARVTGSTFRFKQCKGNGTSGCTGGANDNHDNSGIYIHVRDHVISGNIFLNLDYPIENGVPSEAGGAIETHMSPSTVTGNLIDGFGVGINVVGADHLEPDPVDPPSAITVYANALHHVNKGILLWADLGFPLQNVTVAANAIQVANNDWNSSHQGGWSNLGIGFETNLVFSAGPHQGISIVENTVCFQTPLSYSTKAGGGEYTYGIGCPAVGAVSDLLIASNLIVHAPCKGIDASKLTIYAGGQPVPYEPGPVTGMRITGNLIANAGYDTSPWILQEWRAAICSKNRMLVDCLIDDNHISSDPSLIPPYWLYVSAYTTPPWISNLCIRNNHISAHTGPIPAHVISGGTSIFQAGGTARPVTPGKYEFFFNQNTSVNRATWYDGTDWIDADDNVVPPDG